jgi:large subunit ribosomal protein L1
MNLGVDASKSDQMVRGSVVLPAGTPTQKRVAVFTSDKAKQEEAKAAGAVLVGGEELITTIEKNGISDIDITIATPDMMAKIAKIAKVLGPKGLMPNPKTGTVGVDVPAMIKEIAGGKINFKNDDTGNIHLIIGKTNFSDAQIIENFKTALEAITKSKPSTVKGQFLVATYINATMGPSVRVKA